MTIRWVILVGLPVHIFTLMLKQGLKIRYHCDVADQRLAQHIDKGNEDGLLISSVASCSNLWALIMDSGTLSPLKFTNSLISQQGLDYATAGEILLY
uniref:DUF7477 domain-containing protein n=2 Tax=Helianthus annuus TaxID=4232 RepID=A0A251VQV0_HELAN